MRLSMYWNCSLKKPIGGQWFLVHDLTLPVEYTGLCFVFLVVGLSLLLVTSRFVHAQISHPRPTTI